MNKSKTQSRNPSFSSSLLDEIYNSIDHKPHKTQSFLGSINTSKKQSMSVTRSSVPDRRFHQDRFFGSVSSSSDSNSSIFSSSDTELTHTKKTISSSSSRPLCFGPSKPKPIKTEDNKALFRQNRANRASKDHDYFSDTSKISRCDENWDDNRIRRSSKSHKKPKTPASPGVRIVNFINSLFSNNSKQASMAVKRYPRKMSHDDSVYVKKTNGYNPSTCSSASSFTRSCMNKSSEKSSDRIKRSVRFSPVNVIVPVSRNFLEEEEDYFSRKSVKKNVVEEGGRRSVEEIAREFLRDYHKNHENSLVKSNDYDHDYDVDGDDDDDVVSDSSSDLFELNLDGNNNNNNNNNHHNMYGDELPVYETTFAGLIL
ncbi:unnamed protein product [Cochlearia groenlandica]